MKEYELYSQMKVIKDLPILLRVDGRSFSNYTKELNLKKPFDDRLRDIFIEVSKDLIKEFDVKYVYTFSDEINILLENVPFSGRIEKLDSVFSSFITGSFMKHLYLNKDEFDIDFPILKPASFDCRIIVTSKHIKDYFKWRQDEAWRNCLNTYAQYILNKNHTSNETSKILFKMNKVQLHDLLYKNDINIAHVPTWQKRGVAIYKTQEKIKGYNPITQEETFSYRNKIFVDLDIKLIK